jgi:hypothetical protein
VFSDLLDGVSRTSSRHGAKHARVRVPVAVVVAGALVALTGCGASKPAYCSNRAKLESSVKDLPSAVSAGGISGLTSQITTIKGDATAIVSAAKTDFPNETSAVKTSVDSLESAVKALPSSPSTAQIAAVGVDAASVVNSVKSLMDASQSKCS